MVDDDDGEEDDPAQQRQREEAEALPGTGAIQLGRLVELLGQADDGGEEEDRPVADTAPDIERGQHLQRGVGAQPDDRLDSRASAGSC